ncbi:MAG: polymerase, sigma 70 subunit, RpoD [Candidatus Saccharibacteria bacterium]|nr:polymerase, sigma 70 subunit, RpoD [Candidatus Saccharibacteria bacterium]
MTTQPITQETADLHLVLSPELSGTVIDFPGQPDLAAIRAGKEQIGEEEAAFLMERGSLVGRLNAKIAIYRTVERMQAAIPGIECIPSPRKLRGDINVLAGELAVTDVKRQYVINTREQIAERAAKREARPAQARVERAAQKLAEEKAQEKERQLAAQRAAKLALREEKAAARAAERQERTIELQAEKLASQVARKQAAERKAQEAEQHKVAAKAERVARRQTREEQAKADQEAARIARQQVAQERQAQAERNKAHGPALRMHKIFLAKQEKASAAEERTVERQRIAQEQAEERQLARERSKAFTEGRRMHTVFLAKEAKQQRHDSYETVANQLAGLALSKIPDLAAFERQKINEKTELRALQNSAQFIQLVAGEKQLPIAEATAVRLLALRLSEVYTALGGIQHRAIPGRAQGLDQYLDGSALQEIVSSGVMTSGSIYTLLPNAAKLLNNYGIGKEQLENALAALASDPTTIIEELLPMPTVIAEHAQAKVAQDAALAAARAQLRAREPKPAPIPRQRQYSSEAKSKAPKLGPEKNTDFDLDERQAGIWDENTEYEPGEEDSVKPIDIVKRYFQDIGKTPLLTAVEEVDLAKQVEAGLYAEELLSNGNQLSPSYERDLKFIVLEGQKAHRHLIEANLRLTVSIAKRYQGKGLDLLDLVSEGNLGLIRAVEKFDYTKGYKFSTYATWWIRQALQRSLADKARSIRVPVHMNELISKVNRVRRELTQTLSSEPTPEQIGTELDLTPERVMEVIQFGKDTLSLQSPIGDDDSTLGDFIADKHTVDPYDEADKNMDMGMLWKMLDKLTFRERQVITMRFGLDDDRPKTLDEIGRLCDLTREGVRQVEIRALGKLRHPSQMQRLENAGLKPED